MRVQDMQQFLTSFTEGSDAVKNAVILCEVEGTLYDVRRMEVHENAKRDSREPRSEVLETCSHVPWFPDHGA
jgi:hypothetical protein